MFKRLLSVVLIASAAMFLTQCTDKNDSNPVDGSIPDTLQIGGITETDDLGYIMGGDLTDWCYSPNKSTNNDPPTEYALYPAFPNASYYYFTIIYDLPAQSDVYLSVTDSAGAEVANLVNETQEAGRYISGWDIRDNSETRLTPGIYRVSITANEFVCHGDIEVLPVPVPDPEAVVIYTETLGDTLAVSYDSPYEIGALWMIFVFNEAVGNPRWEQVTWIMNSFSETFPSNSDDKPDTLRIFVRTPLDQIRTMPSGEHSVCKIPIVSGQISLDYVEVSDGLGEETISSAIIKKP